MDEAKLDVFRDYLSEAFSGLKIDEKDDFDLAVRKFKVLAETQTYRLHVGRDFIFDTDSDEIAKKIRAWDIASLMRTPDIHYVHIDNSGPQTRLAN